MSNSAEELADTRDVRGTIAFRGPDAAKFLHGQLSADVLALAPGATTLAGLHNPQGRVTALLSLAHASEGEFLATLPRELVASVIERLRKYVLRAKVRIEELVESPPATDAIAAIRAGVPEVYAATSEQFVAQMLNLDLLGAISFEKGCYTGQEVIARAHYRGRVKRRAQRWLNDSGTALAPGDAARTEDGRALQVVRVASLPEGGQEILAVGNFVAGVAPAPADAGGVVVRGPLPLPYALPE